MAVKIYLIYPQFTKYRMRITRQRSEYGRTTNYVMLIQQMT